MTLPVTDKEDAGRDGNNEPASGTNAASSQSTVRDKLRKWSERNRSDESSVIVGRDADPSTLDGSVESVSVADAGSVREIDSEGTRGTGRRDRDSSGESSSWIDRIGNFAQQRGINVGSAGSDDDSEETYADTSSAVIIDSPDVGEKKRRGRPKGSKNAGSTSVPREKLSNTYERAVRLVARTPFWVASIVTHIHEFKLTDEEYETIKEPAINVAQQYLPAGIAKQIVQVSDIAALAEAVLTLVDMKMTMYRMNKLQAEQKVDEILSNRNGYAPEAMPAFVKTPFG